MKWVWAVAAIPLACAGCKPQASPPPPPTACRVDLSRLVAAHPRWQEVRALDARIRDVQGRLGSVAAPPAAVALPPPLPPVPDATVPTARSAPRSLDDMATARDAAVRAQREALAERHKARLQRERLERETESQFLAKQRHTRAFEELWQEQEAIIRRHQPEITRLRILVTRLRDASPIPEVEEGRARELASERQKLVALERRRKAELDAIAKRVEEQVAKELGRRKREDTTAIEALRAELRSQQETAIRTAEQDWQDRIDAAGETLQDPPPGPAIPDAERDAAPIAPSVTIAPAPDPSQAAAAAVAAITQQRTRLHRFIQAETRQRVLGIAARNNLRPEFSGGPRLPDRTDFFLREIRRAGT